MSSQSQAIQSTLEAALLSLKLAAPQVKARLEDKNCEEYSQADVEALLLKWFTESIDQLALEVVYHTSEGDRSCAFNRDGFNRLASKLEAVEQSDLIAA